MRVIMEETDVTVRATSAGWALPDGWTIVAEFSPDDRITDIEQEYDHYAPAQVAAWRNDEWRFVVLCVFVCDADGRDWGRSILGGVEQGWLPLTDERGTVTGTEYIDPLADDHVSVCPVREHDMIREALEDAVRELDRFGTPVIREPSGPGHVRL